MMKLIVGLGNPGEKFGNTPHNIGFRVIEDMATQKEITFRLEPQFDSRFAEMGDMEDRVKLVQPQTFMNLSGQAVQKCRDYWKVDTEDIWVIHDDVDLDYGKVKVVLGGSSAGHKGVQSIIDSLGTDQFWRVRVGVGRSETVPTEAWVLKKFDQDTTKLTQSVAEKVLLFLENGISNQSIEIN